MPDHSETSTTDLLGALKLRLQGLLGPVDYSEIDEMLDYRVVPETDPVEEMRGGISPTRRP